jgi:hypothetical protein
MVPAVPVAAAEAGVCAVVMRNALDDELAMTVPANVAFELARAMVKASDEVP